MAHCTLFSDSLSPPPPPPRGTWWIMLLLLFFYGHYCGCFLLPLLMLFLLNLPIIQFSSTSPFWCRIFSWFLFVTLNCASVKFSEICNTKNSFFSPKRGPESRRDQWMTLGQELLILRDQLSLSLFSSDPCWLSNICVCVCFGRPMFKLYVLSVGTLMVPPV